MVARALPSMKVFLISYLELEVFLPLNRLTNYVGVEVDQKRQLSQGHRAGRPSSSQHDFWLQRKYFCIIFSLP